MVKMRQFSVLTAHVPAAVEHEDNLLITLVLILPGNRRALAGGGFPVDLAQAVAFTEFPELMELQAQAATLFLAHTELAEPVIHSQQLTAIKAGKVGIDAGVVRRVEQAFVGPQPQGAWQVDFAPFKTKVTALERS
ncbi:hypothetical protein D3C75_1071690 [compost metagenome]